MGESGGWESCKGENVEKILEKEARGVGIREERSKESDVKD